MKERPAIAGGKPVRKKFLIFGSPLISNDEIREVVDTLKSGWISTGPKVTKFEKDFKRYIGCKYAIALNSCTAGLHLALEVTGIRNGDEVITTPFTFAATANVIVNQGARPIFVDINKDTLNIAAKEIEKAISKKTRAIIPVHMAGLPCEMDVICDIAKGHKLRVIEDAAHAIGAEYKGKKIGTLGDITSFSFYATKNITTAEGGMVTTSNKQWADDIKTLSLHGLTRSAWKRYSSSKFRHYDVVFPGYKYNMTDIQASLGIRQLLKIEKYLKIRQRYWKMYDEAFKNMEEIIIPKEIKNIRHARHLYIIRIKPELLKISRDQFVEALRVENIGTGIHFMSLFFLTFYKKRYRFKKGNFPIAERISERVISLPLSAKLTERDINDVISAVRRIITYFRR